MQRDPSMIKFWKIKTKSSNKMFSAAVRAASHSLSLQYVRMPSVLWLVVSLVLSMQCTAVSAHLHRPVGSLFHEHKLMSRAFHDRLQVYCTKDAISAQLHSFSLSKEGQI